MPVDRLRPRYSLKSMVSLPRYRAQQLPLPLPRYRAQQLPLPPREDGLVARVPGRRRYSSYEGEVTPAPGNLVDRDLRRSRAEREMAHGHHAGSRPVTARSTFPR